MKEFIPTIDDIIPLNNHENLIRDILVDFSSIIDTDLGSAGFLLSTYPDSIFFLDECRGWTEYYMKCKIITRENINPITILLKDEYQDSADNLYNELLEQHWEDILKVSPITDICGLLFHGGDFSGYKITVKCRNEEEKNRINKLIPTWNTIMVKEDVSKYFCYFIHDLAKRAVELDGLFAKAIYIYYHKPNFLNFKKGYMIQEAKGIMNNIIKFISPYRGLVLPYDMTPNDMEVETDAKELYSAKRGKRGHEHSERKTVEKGSVKSS